MIFEHKTFQTLAEAEEWVSSFPNKLVDGVTRSNVAEGYFAAVAFDVIE